MTDPSQSIDTDKGRLIEIIREFVGVKEDGSERWVETEYRTVTGREWVGLTDEEAREIRLRVGSASDVYARAIEAALKEKNT